MIFLPLPLEGAFRIDLEPHEDDRGFLARMFCAGEFAVHGLETAWSQCNLAYNRRAGTLRGLHFQRAPGREAKLIRCLTGAVYDVLVDLRPGSRQFGQWCAEELSAANRGAVYVPPGVAHGYQTRLPDTELLYFHSAPFRPDLDAGLNHADPSLSIRWPLPLTALSNRDAGLPMLDHLELLE